MSLYLKRNSIKGSFNLHLLHIFMFRNRFQNLNARFLRHNTQDAVDVLRTELAVLLTFLHGDASSIALPSLELPFIYLHTSRLDWSYVHLVMTFPAQIDNSSKRMDYPRKDFSLHINRKFFLESYRYSSRTPHHYDMVRC